MAPLFRIEYVDVMTRSLTELLDHSAELHDALGELWSTVEPSRLPRGMAVAAYCSIVREHVLSQLHLLALGHSVTAMTLVRPSFEALVRAIWCLDGASDAWVVRFLSPLGPERDPADETIKGPPVEAMLEVIQKRHPAFIHSALTGLKDATWKPMHSYVHGGVRPVLQSLIGCPEAQCCAMVLNANGFAMFSTNVLIIAAGGPQGHLPEIQRRFSACLPPLV